MQFTLPYQETIVLPSGAGPNDSRIEFDGVNGEIRIYLLGVLVGRWRPDDFQVIGPSNSLIEIDPDAIGTGNPGIFITPPDSPGVGGYAPAIIFADWLNSDETPYIAISGTRPLVDPSTGAPRIDLYGPNVAGIDIRPRINLAPNAGVGIGGFVEVVGTESNFLVNGKSLPWGFIARNNASGASAALASVGTVITLPGTATVVTNPSTAVTRRYRAMAFARFNMAGGANGLYRPLVTNNAGAALGSGTAQVVSVVVGGAGQVGGMDIYEFTLAPSASTTVAAGGLRVGGGGATDTITGGYVTVDDIGT